MRHIRLGEGNEDRKHVIEREERKRQAKVFEEMQQKLLSKGKRSALRRYSHLDDDAPTPEEIAAKNSLTPEELAVVAFYLGEHPIASRGLRATHNPFSIAGSHFRWNGYKYERE